MHEKVGKKCLLASLCVFQVALIFFSYNIASQGIPLKQAILRTWEAIEVKSYNLRRSVFGSPLSLNVTNTTITNDTGWIKIHNKSVDFDILPDCIRKPFLVMLVITTPNDFLRRHVIRTTWGGTHKQIKLNQSAVYHGEVFDLTKLKLVFVVGHSKGMDTDAEVQKEAIKYGDILRASLNETYRNIVHKVFWAYSWALSLKPQFVLKADHDVYINIRQLLSWLQKPFLPPLLYTGFIHSRVIVHRNKNSPHYVSKDDLSRDMYPEYCAGPCYVTSIAFLSKAITDTSRVKVFEVEDAYLGVVANHLGISPHRTFRFYWDRGNERRIRHWSDRKLSKYVCIGDSLETEFINHLHYRYMRL